MKENFFQPKTQFEPKYPEPEEGHLRKEVKAKKIEKQYDQQHKAELEEDEQQDKSLDHRLSKFRLETFAQEIIQTNEFKFVQRVQKKFPNAGIHAVGGSIRDLVLDTPSKDIDLVVNHIKPHQLIKILNKHGRVVFDKTPDLDLSRETDDYLDELITESFGVIKFHPSESELQEPIDIAFTRIDKYDQESDTAGMGVKRNVETVADPNADVTEDLARRDLTINTIVVNLVNGEIIDPNNGIDDLMEGKIKMVGNPHERISEDATRAFRAIRFSCKFNAEIDPETKKAIAEIFKPLEHSLADQELNKITALKNQIKEIKENQELEWDEKMDQIDQLVKPFFEPDRINLDRVFFQKMERLKSATNKLRDEKNTIASANLNKTIMLINEEARKKRKKAADPNVFYDEQIPLINGLIDSISNKHQDIKNELKQIFNLSHSENIYAHVSMIEESFTQEREKIKKNYKIEGEEIPWFLEIYSDKNKEGFPKRIVQDEMIRIEMFKALKANPIKFIELMDEVGGLKYILPEIEKLKGVAQPPEHHSEGDVMIHTKLLLKELPDNAPIELILAAIFHDIGKPATFKMLEKKDSKEKRIVFYGHEDESVELISDIANRFKFPDEVTKKVKWLAQNHMILHQKDLPRMNDKKVRKYFLENEEMGLLLIDLARADTYASIPQGESVKLDNLRIILEKIKNVREKSTKKVEKGIPKGIINGKDLKEIGLKPGQALSLIHI